MPMSEHERREWRDLEAQLSHEPQLVRLARQLGGGGMPRRTTTLWLAGGGLGAALVGVGTAGHSLAISDAGVAVLIVTLLVVGVALVVVGWNG